jgi:hypothetical protein
MNSIALKITFVLELMDRYLRTYELKAKFNWCEGMIMMLCWDVVIE